jgi:hypothetical protein
MSSIVRDLARARAAFDKPTLALLSRRKWAPLVLAIFTSQFTRERSRIPADRFHVQVETVLDELRLHGHEVPDKPARDLCREWVADRWLSLTSNEANVEEYALTSHAQEALDYVERLAGDRALFGESRIMTILDAARRCATEATPDREDRLRRLNDQIEKLTTERDRIAAGGDIPTASDDRMHDEYLNLHSLLAALPSDFMRVSEAVKEIHRSIIADFRADERRSGEVLDDYLARADRLMNDSLEGRAFTGAVELLRDDDLLESFAADLDAILAHDFASTRLTGADRTNLRRTVTGIRTGLEVVLQQRRRLSGTLRTHMARHDPLRDKELDEALRQCGYELGRWMETAGPRAKVAVDHLALPLIEVGHLRERLYDPADHTPPPPLRDPDEEEGFDGLSFDDLRKQGGPDLRGLRAAIDAWLDETGSVTLAEVFANLPDRLRRPVEILGLIHLAVTDSGVEPTEDTPVAAFETIRPDGAHRVFRAPALTVTATTETTGTPDLEGADR